MLTGLLPWLLLQSTTSMTSDAPERALEVVEVRSAPFQARTASIPGVSTLDRNVIALENPTHANELFDRVPSTWVSRGSGQEQLVAIRSPVLTGAGACGAYMVLEDHVPIRPAGFCNVNELFEVNLQQADRVDVIRGPGSVIYGSNALHGVIDIVSGAPRPGFDVGLELGTDDYVRGRFSASSDVIGIHGSHTDSGSFRIDEGYRQSFANFAWNAEAFGANVATRLAYAHVDQDTAGYVLGEGAYRDPVLRRTNPNPEAFREATAWRVSSRWIWPPSPGARSRFELIPYARHSDMDFLQHFLPGKPLERNGQSSAGLLLAWSSGTGLSAGVDAEWANGDLVEFQDNPTEGSAFLVETRPQGFHYDYEVRSVLLAAWLQAEFNMFDKQTFTLGLRGELLDYAYDNRMRAGNTRDDGTACGFGGCLYTRPGDRDDRFENLAPELGYTVALNDHATLRARLARGYRAPQATELYRLQQGQSVADLETETLDALEAGVSIERDALAWNLTAYAMRKRHYIFRDADGYNVSNGRTDHLGLEGEIDWAINEIWRLSANAGWARHEYAFDRPESGIASGHDVDTSPRWLGGARLTWTPAETGDVEIEWAHTGRYALDPANDHHYGGHDLVNVRGVYRWRRSGHQLAARITNLFDSRYAERADYAFGNYRYFPGAGRRIFIEWRYQR